MKYSYVKFTNVSDKDFVGRFDQEDYLIKAGESQYFPPFLAKHFSKRLADREMILQFGKPLLDDPIRQRFVLKCLDMADEKTLETLEKQSLKKEIEEQRKMLDNINEDEKETLRKEIMGEIPDETPVAPEPEEEIGEVEFTGSLEDASNKIRMAIETEPPKKAGRPKNS
jgi:hypothetical protein